MQLTDLGKNKFYVEFLKVKIKLFATHWKWACEFPCQFFQICEPLGNQS